jgi:hypothetical protein
MSRSTDQLDNSHTKPLQMEHHEHISSDRSQTDGRPGNSESQARQFLPNSLIASQRKARSSLVRRFVQAQDERAKQRTRRWLGRINNEQFLGFGLTPEDIALLRGSRSAGKFVSTLLSVPSPPGSWF